LSAPRCESASVVPNACGPFVSTGSIAPAAIDFDPEEAAKALRA
jgi:hypothetical protein